MKRNRGIVAIKMLVGCVIGVVGFATLSSGFVTLLGTEMMTGLGEILLGTFLVMGVLAPLRSGRNP